MRKSMLIAAAVAVAAPLGALAGPALSATKTVKVGDNWFVRSSGVPTVSISPGSRLRFSWVGDSAHNVVGVGISLGSSCKRVRSSGTCTTPALRRRGRFTLYCQVHGRRDQSMRLRIG